MICFNESLVPLLHFPSSKFARVVCSLLLPLQRRLSNLARRKTFGMDLHAIKEGREEGGIGGEGRIGGMGRVVCIG